ncbi:PEP/pyruvate-binding domain-containing protein [Arthrobacter sp. M4]|uniref:PEP/pyruvate-binding domain-containing protein n=1 Tax=Arthrobacter sp. M4 TaxID=218160 RepID=UPI001CDBF7C6|nr:PEP/pyruvate-binding domain-containing protein [Arthrobacter sp. M4]MCA4135588.1 hypothetical protein [Arthrobacter sp. M4]
MTEEFTTPLDRVTLADIALAGGKGAALGELRQQGFPVPAGFVVTTRGYDAALAETGIGAALEELLHASPEKPDGGPIRALFGATAMPAAVRSEIAKAYAELGSGAVAVRSSATAEDLPGAAFAGQQDTFLNVQGEDAVVNAVSECWASLWTDRAISYRQRRGIDPHEVSIAVVVQNMVPADTAGVMFTANPLSGERDNIVVEASAGLGESVVSGSVTPDHYLLDRAGRVLEFSPGDRSVEPPLRPDQLAQLAALGRRSQEHFGRPQDMEWAAVDGRFYVVQSRPMTALPPQPPHLNPFQKRVGPFFVEMFQRRPYPLDVSGWLSQGIVAMLHRMAGSVGVTFPRIEELLPEEDGVVLQLIPPVPRPTIRALAAPMSVLRRYRQYKGSDWTQDQRFMEFQSQLDRVNSADLGELRWKDVVSVAKDCFAAMRYVTELRTSYMPGIFLPQLKLRVLLLLLGRMSLAPSLVAGAETRTTQANRALERLADMAGENPGLSAAFMENDSSTLWKRVKSEPDFGAFRTSFEAFLKEYGNRETVSVVLSSSPTWADAPEVVLGIVKAMMGERRQAPDQTGAALDELKRHPALRFGPLRDAVVDAVDRAREGMAFREDSHFAATKVLPPLRRAYRELGDRLVRAGVVDAVDDVNHLRFEELEAIRDNDDGALPPSVRERFRPVVLARAAKRAELEGIPLLDTSLLFARPRHADALASGTPASRGTAEGPVRIIRGPEEFGMLRSGDVLVCPYTNPSWTPLFQRAVAVVVDTGGLGSHAAIVAREYGIPAVMGTGSGTAVLSDGQQVRVDGNAGVVVAL